MFQGVRNSEILQKKKKDSNFDRKEPVERSDIKQYIYITHFYYKLKVLLPQKENKIMIRNMHRK